MLFTFSSWSYNRDAADQTFLREQKNIATLVEQCGPKRACQRVLIPRLRGLEDSSRFWSVAMTLDHLRITNAAFAGIIRNLATNVTPPGVASTAAVKPSNDASLEVLHEYNQSCSQVMAAVAENPKLNTTLKFAHPWFGAMNAERWHLLAGIHMSIHRKQIQAILERLDASEADSHAQRADGRAITGTEVHQAPLVRRSGGPGHGEETPRTGGPQGSTLPRPMATQSKSATKWGRTILAPKSMKCCLAAWLLCFCFLVNAEKASAAREGRYEVEAGVLSTRNMDLHGFHQSNATRGWDSSEPAVRLEAWSVKPDGWNFGGVLQPVYLKYSDRLSSDWTAKGKDFRKGEEADLTYQFHSLRGTANYPVLLSLDRESYLRLGVSGILRYADVRFRSAGQTHHGTNLIGFPLLNVEGKVPVSKSYSFFTRSDLLPSPTGDVFLDGLFDVFAGVRKTLTRGSTLDVGVRLFFGGYDPDRKGDYGNRIFLQGLVVRYSW
jgi:uncharacterized damage-inducible protein DinB